MAGTCVATVRIVMSAVAKCWLCGLRGGCCWWPMCVVVRAVALFGVACCVVCCGCLGLQWVVSVSVVFVVAVCFAVTCLL